MKRRLGIALSGGGYRAAAFHLGTLKALERLGLLSKIDVISSVSGGSIISAYYLLHKDETFVNFEQSFRTGLMKSSLTVFIINLLIVLSIPIILSFIFNPWFLSLYFLLIPFGFDIIPSSKWIECAYDHLFFENKKLKDLPDKPILGINSTNIVKGRLFTFSKQDVGGYDYRENGISNINGQEISISYAVTCSTCVPMFFSPRSINKKFFKKGKFKENLLIDGGLYDNQGAYILCEGTNKLYRVEDIIVSDAGNSEPSIKFLRNTFGLMYQSLEILMNRIRTMQIRNNIYDQKNINSSNLLFAYLSLRWDQLESMPNRFVDNIKRGFVSNHVLKYHNITQDDVESLFTDNEEKAYNIIIQKFKKSVGWSNLLNDMPTEEDYKIAYSVKTNLMPLSERQISALSKYADWLAELQIKTYLPHLIR